MNPHVEGDSRTVKPFKFSDSFLAGFNALITTYDKKIEDLNKVKSLIDKDAHHGVCDCSYKMRYITPSDISTFISNLERAMENHLFKPHTSDCDLFAVESVKRFLNGNGCIPFDAPTIMGDPGADIPKGATLADLTFAAENECFNLIVYSKYELDKRVDCMREDIGKIQNMHFSAAVKSFVQKLPDIMNKKATFVMKDSLLAKALEVYIEDFIMFAVRLNLTTVLQMLAYAIPRVVYKNEPSPVQSNESANNSDNWDEDNDFFQQEAVDTTKKSPVFFIFSKGKTPFISNAIKKATHSEYSHASIAFDPSLNPMYSFGDATKPDTYQTGTWGFKREDIHGTAYNDVEVSVYGAYIDNDKISRMKELVEDFDSHNTKFDKRILLNKLMHLDKKPGKNKYKQVCSTFVDYLMNDVGIKKGNKKLMSPEDIRTSISQFEDSAFEVFSGKANDYSAKKSDKKISDKGKEEKSKAFDEVVTECCSGFLKTNDYVITNKIPFNCNMRDVVLQDMHPQFKDTVSALKFIMNDERSPVHQLVIQYYTEPIDDYDPDMIIKMFFGCPRHNHWEDPNSRDQLANEKANMNTDVNWLDKITYGNMFYDGNYRRDGLGNQHTHPIMNSFETIYKMFGGCDNVCDNAALSNSLIRISRVMKAIIERYCDGNIPNWEMCRDILSVFGEIFTRHMLRLYYNNNHYMVAKDQMRDTMVPGYMFAEAYILETNGFTSNNTDNYNKAKGGMQNVKNAAGNFINWLRDKLATFMPKYFETSLQKQCEWFDKNGKAKYDEIKTAAGKSYNFPSKDKYYKFNVTFDPGKIKAYDIIKSYKDDPNKDLSGLRKELMNAFDNDTNDLAGKLSQMNGENLKKAVENAVLYSSIEEQKPEIDHRLTTNDWDAIYNDMVFMCHKDQDGKFRGGKWSNDMKQLSNDLQKAVKELQPEQKPNTESFEIKLGKNMFYVEMDENDGKADVATTSNSGQPAAPAKASTPAETQNQGQPQNSEGETGTNDAAKAKRDGDILKQVEDIAAAFLVVSANTIVSKLFPNIYNNFKGVIDDYDATKNGGTDAKSQQTANAGNNQQNAQS
jgi:hypothetical protein